MTLVGMREYSREGMVPRVRVNNTSDTDHYQYLVGELGFLVDILTEQGECEKGEGEGEGE
jgi:hypothetical protein